MNQPESRHADRMAAHGAVSTHLSLLSDQRLTDIVAGATPLGSGIGGRSAKLDIAGTPVFVKRVPLTDIELQRQHARSTAISSDCRCSTNTGLAPPDSEHGVNWPCTP